MSEHRPGPWRWSGRALRGPEGVLVLDISVPAEAAHFVMTEADARLIADAPELLEALKPLAMMYCDFHRREEQQALLADWPAPNCGKCDVCRARALVRRHTARPSPK